MFSFSAVVSGILKRRCPACFRYQNYATKKRFYQETRIIQNDNKWEVTVDHRRLRTPNGQIMKIGSEPLARAIAAEWDAQAEYISQPSMYLTTLCNTAQDNPANFTKHDIANYLLDYAPTDTLLFQCEDEKELWQQQQEKWVPILEWFEKRFNITQEFSKGLEPPPVSAKTRETLARHYLSYDFEALNALCFGVESLKSPILMLACVDQHVEPKEAVLLSRLEEEYQLMRWGRVEWAHQLNQVETTARVAAALFVVQCCTERHSSKSKAPRQNQQTSHQ